LKVDMKKRWLIVKIRRRVCVRQFSSLDREESLCTVVVVNSGR
jgi:hypothetical protein